MADTIPASFRRPGGNAIASYSFTELATATGQLSLFPVKLSGANSLVSNEIYGNKAWSSNETSTFETIFNRPFNIKGSGALVLPVAIIYTGAGVGAAGTALFTWTIQHTNTAGTQIMITSGAGTFSYKGNRSGNLPTDQTTLSFMVDYTPLTHLKIGEKITLNVVSPSNPADNQIYYGHDPQNRSALPGTSVNGTTSVGLSWTTSKSELRIPIRIEP